MTVCIAAVCEENTSDPKIILCTDNKISGALGSADTGLKVRTIKLPNWSCLTAGSDSGILAIVRMFQDEFREVEEIDETNVGSVIRSALVKYKKTRADELIQSKHVISYDDFLAKGKSCLPEDIFRASTYAVEKLSLGATFIVSGYSGGFPLLAETDEHCGVKLREDFATIGEGAYLAHASLMRRGHRSIDTFSEALYNVYEAKRFAEGAPTVGESTCVLVQHRNGKQDILNWDGILFLRDKYDDFGPKAVSEFSVPDSLFERLGKK